MCGIAGIMTRDGSAPEPEALDRLAAALGHRGPDGTGRHRAGSVGMVQTRLAIIDLETGDQPFDEPGGAALIANAEIYNYVELRRDELAEIALVSDSDCEPALHLYRRLGADYVRRLRGMYAIAVHDRPAERLVLARDPFGIKPLYFAETERAFVFASEPQALVGAGLIEPRLNAKARNEFFQLQFVAGPETLFAGIMRVLPGETLIVEAGRIVERRQIPALPEGAPEDVSEAEALERLDRAFADSVEVHQRSDVPYGMFLSGGIDSSAVLAMMARLSERPVRAFTVGFSGTGVHDERAHARDVARAVGAEHVEVDFTEADFWTLLPEVAVSLDDGAADYAVLPTYKLAESAGRDLKVILSGEGGDELFAGYGRYRRAMRPWWLGGRSMRTRGTFDGLGVLREETTVWRNPIAAAEASAAVAGRSRLQAAQAADCVDWLPHDLLIKLDRCLMAHAVEGRTPFLDPVLAEAVFRLPDRLKVRRRLGKWLLRRWLDTHLPEALPFTAKRGFTVPVAEWIAARGAALAPLVARQPGIEEACRPDAVEALFRDGARRAGFACWVLLFYALWHRHHMLGRLPAGDALETLAAGG